MGENLAGRSDSADLVSLSRLDPLLERVRSGPLPVLVPGQGVEERERKIVRAKLRRYGLTEALLVNLPAPAPLSPSEVHKRRPENVLVAGLHKAENDLFRATLRISDQQEMILDHTTGSHVTGMVITEAVRQLSLAVGERYLLTPSDTARRFILNSLQTTFHRFLLPLPTRLEYRLADIQRNGPDRLRFTGTCDLLQADVLAASGSVDIVVMDEKCADRIEARHLHEMTRVLAKSHVQQHQESPRRALSPATVSQPS
ncbi:A-factor biosynthesis protein AfsA [Streptomyces sp. NBC_00988]|uniref:AfsA-related hotdog domain-containing protein n=1 Tax=Streptomyces sp. NBC_00988 TaxID=2903704 RepID=UPI00386A3618|nr:A-factor biosynthesis protein AfsA [Streptomyces sp. NBC_00988]